MGSAFAVEAPEAEHSEAAQKLVNKLKGCPHFVTCRTKNETVEVDITLLGERRQKVVAQVDSMVESVMKLSHAAWSVSYRQVDRDTEGLCALLSEAVSTGAFHQDPHVVIDSVSIPRSGVYVTVRLWCDDTPAQALAEHILQTAKLSLHLRALMRLEVMFDNHLLAGKLRRNLLAVDEVWVNNKTGGIEAASFLPVKLPAWLESRVRVHKLYAPMAEIMQAVKTTPGVVAAQWQFKDSRLHLIIQTDTSGTLSIAVEELAHPTIANVLLQHLPQPTASPPEAKTKKTREVGHNLISPSPTPDGQRQQGIGRGADCGHGGDAGGDGRVSKDGIREPRQGDSAQAAGEEQNGVHRTGSSPDLRHCKRDDEEVPGPGITSRRGSA